MDESRLEHTTKDGQKRWVTEVVAEDVHFLSAKGNDTPMGNREHPLGHFLFCTSNKKLYLAYFGVWSKGGEFEQCIITLKKVKPCII
ncbi:hypothetical protein DOT_0869 [Desulfosporosinus sp. OT]|nr:hypothetical protein DOT_0869 [Desulfosporosinus sp. OT]